MISFLEENRMREQKKKLYLFNFNHFYDYLDAGIPIIAAVPVMFADFFEKQGVLIKWTLEDYDFNLLRKQRDVLRKNVSKVREELKVDKHIGELIEFYNSI